VTDVRSLRLSGNPISDPAREAVRERFGESVGID
jgi:hypothetical protein